MIYDLFILGIATATMVLSAMTMTTVKRAGRPYGWYRAWFMVTVLFLVYDVMTLGGPTYS